MDIHKLLSLAVGETVVHSLTGGAAGSIWALRFENNSSFMIYCAWRIECNEKVITTSCDDATPLVGRMNVNVQKMTGKKLLSYTLSKQNDLILYFDYNFIIRMFCNIGLELENTKEGCCDENWDFCIPSLDIAVSATTDFRKIYTKYYSNDRIIE